MVAPNPKTSGGARWDYLAAWGYALQKPGGDDATAREFVRKLYKNVPVLDSGARGSTTTFGQRGIGDVLVVVGERGLPAGQRARQGQVRDRRTRRVSILAEPPVAVVDKNVDKHGTRAVAEAYLKFLYTRRGAGASRSRTTTGRAAPRSPPSTPARSRRSSCSRSTSVFGGWQKAQATHFADGGMFDQIYQPGS